MRSEKSVTSKPYGNTTREAFNNGVEAGIIITKAYIDSRFISMKIKWRANRNRTMILTQVQENIVNFSNPDVVIRFHRNKTKRLEKKIGYDGILERIFGKDKVK